MTKLLLFVLAMVAVFTAISYSLHGSRVLPVWGALGALYVGLFLLQVFCNWSNRRALHRCRAF